MFQRTSLSHDCLRYKYVQDSKDLKKSYRFSMMFRSIYSHGIPFLVGFSSHKGISEDGDVKLYPTQGPRCEALSLVSACPLAAPVVASCCWGRKSLNKKNMFRPWYTGKLDVWTCNSSKLMARFPSLYYHISYIQLTV